MTYTDPQLLIEPVELADRIGASALRIFDATVFLKPAEKGYRAESGLDSYREGHIPGAAFMDQIAAVSDTSSGLGFTLPAEDYLQSALRKLGINNDSQVVVYSTGHMMWTTRAWWLLHYAGHASVRVLNGGYAGWQAVDGPINQQDESYEPGDFTLRTRPSTFVDQAGVLAAIGDPAVCTVNALNPGVYSGSAAMSYGRKGHITGSINLFYDDLLDGDRFRDAKAITESLRAKGLLEAERVVTYCGGGISATIDAFACLLVGKEKVAVYDGSMSEWVRDESLPMTEGEMPD
ncbi:MAG: sulfurtransferase [Gammaproteobacteria bacterium]|nr:sulfurtransferase [Gammaproteobacteria bacterium]